MPKKSLTLALALTLPLALAACSKPPQKELDAAQSLLDQAKAAGGESYAADSYGKAQESMTQAKAEVEAQSAKFRLMQSYGKARVELSTCAAALLICSCLTNSTAFRCSSAALYWLCACTYASCASSTRRPASAPSLNSRWRASRSFLALSRESGRRPVRSVLYNGLGNGGDFGCSQICFRLIDRSFAFRSSVDEITILEHCHQLSCFTWSPRFT